MLISLRSEAVDPGKAFLSRLRLLKRLGDGTPASERLTAPQPHIDVGVPAVNLKDRLPIGDGMLTIYEALKKGPNA